MKTKKYKLQNKKHIIDGITLYRIVALKNFADIKRGNIGGFVGHENILSQEGNCWIYDNAQCYYKAKISENAKISEKAKIAGNSHILGKAKIKGGVYVSGNIEISGDVCLTGEIQLFGSGMKNDEKKTIITGNIQII